MIGRHVDINKHPFTIIGVAPRSSAARNCSLRPRFGFPLVEAADPAGRPTICNIAAITRRGSWAGSSRAATPAQAAADLNAIGAWLAKTYPADDEGIKFSLARPGLGGDMLGGPASAFMAGLMLLAGLILLAACANLGSLFAARAADRAKEVALRLALGSRRATIIRQLLTEALLVSLREARSGLPAASSFCAP